MSIVCAAGMAICYSQFGRLSRSTSDPGSIKSAPCRRTIVPVIGGVAPEGAVLEFARAIVNRRVAAMGSCSVRIGGDAELSRDTLEYGLERWCQSFRTLSSTRSLKAHPELDSLKQRRRSRLHI